LSALRAFGDPPVYGRVFGEGDPVVLALHGWARTSSDFTAVLAGLDAIALDLPGFGASPAPSAAIGSAGYADLVASVLDRFERPPLVLGHSFGGRVALHLAARGLTRGLVLTGVPLVRRGPGQRPSVGYRLVRLGHRLSLVSDARMEALKRNRGSADYRNASGVMRDILVTAVNESYESLLSDLDGPVDLVWGADDAEVPVSVARRAKDLMTRAEVSLEVVPGHGHMLPLSGAGHLRSVLVRRLANA
jgi:pimeloyl-ACP methyl ester carboxylesterase